MHLKKLSRHGKRWKANLSSPICLFILVTSTQCREIWAHDSHPMIFSWGPKMRVGWSWLVLPDKNNLSSLYDPSPFANFKYSVFLSLRSIHEQSMWKQNHIADISDTYNINMFFHQLDVEVKKKLQSHSLSCFFWECLDPKRSTIKGGSWIYLLTQKQFHWSNHWNKRLPFSILHTMDCRVRGLETSSWGTRFASWH